MKILRTPDACFDNLVGYPFDPHYLEISDGEGQDGQLGVHYVDCFHAPYPEPQVLPGNSQ